MHLAPLSPHHLHHFDAAFQLYTQAFPREERRDLEEQRRILSFADYHFQLLLEGDTLLGIVLYWEVGELIFLEHLATMPQRRNQGLGSAALSLLKQQGKTILLEMEPPADNLTRRRYGFYQCNGFQMNHYHHIQAKYRQGDPDVVLKILSFPQPLTEGEYHDFYDYLLRYIAIQ